MIVLDAGALVALERGDRTLWADMKAAALAGIPITVPAGALAQVWRGTPRQARLARALAGCDIASFDAIARESGVLCGAARTGDAIDASVAITAHDIGANRLYTSDPTDLRHLLHTLGARHVQVVRC